MQLSNAPFKRTGLGTRIYANECVYKQIYRQINKYMYNMHLHIPSKKKTTAKPTNLATLAGSFLKGCLTLGIIASKSQNVHNQYDTMICDSMNV